MPHERWQEISPHLDHALSLSEVERADWLAAFRTQRPDLADLLEKLLEEHRALAEEHFLEHEPLRPVNQPSSAGETLGAYKLISRIGEGGMGNVWLAERSDGRFERRVAVKFLNFAVASQGAAERFKREGRILGQLAHPHIAELIDAGVTPRGEPYLVLEYVEGKQIDEYCDEHSVGLNARIALFLDVLGAVAHAHANLVVHRDIKPSNVLISSAREVKLLDFGIAKLLAEETDSAPATLFTIEGGGAMTLLFAAPEQVTSGAITTATDVYALGVLLFLLLTGNHPVGPGPHSPAHLVRAITESESPRLSDAVDPRDETSAKKRGASPERLRRSLQGDLDLIVGKALKTKPQERYVSVAAFGDDLQRYLQHEPISARPDAVSYRLRKYVRRHRVGVGLVTAMTLLLTGFAVIQAVQLRRITRERDRADRIADFMTGVFKVSDPSERVGNSVTAQEILDNASKEIGTSLSKDLELQARMMHVMGKAYMMLGLQHQAQSLFERSIKLASASIGPEDPETMRTMSDLSWTLFQQGHITEAESRLRALLEQERRVLGSDHRDTLGTMDQLASTLCEEGKCAEAAKLDREVLERERRLLGPEAFNTLATMDNLSWVLALNGQLAEAEKLEEETLAIQMRIYGFENLGTINSMMNLASIQRDMGKYDDAEKLFHRTLDLEARVLGPDQPETAETTYGLACLLARRGKVEEALALLGQAIDHGLHPRLAVKIEDEPSFKSLHGDQRFAALVAHAKELAATKYPN